METLTFASWLKEKMFEKGATLRQVSAYTSVSPSTLVDHTKGRCMPSPATCYKLAEYFKVDADLLLELAGHRPLKDGDLPDFPSYLSIQFKDQPLLQRALLSMYEAFTKSEHDRPAQTG